MCFTLLLVCSGDNQTSAQIPSAGSCAAYRRDCGASTASEESPQKGPPKISAGDVSRAECLIVNASYEPYAPCCLANKEKQKDRRISRQIINHFLILPCSRAGTIGGSNIDTALEHDTTPTQDEEATNDQRVFSSIPTWSGSRYFVRSRSENHGYSSLLRSGRLALIKGYYQIYIIYRCFAPREHSSLLGFSARQRGRTTFLGSDDICLVIIR